MFVITDSFDVVQDMATEEANLSRGCNYVGYKLYKNVRLLGNVQVGDKMKKTQVTTGFGYIQDKDGRIIAKAELPLGEHLLKDDHEYIEVADRAALNEVQVIGPAISPAEQLRIETERKISSKTRELAVKALIADGRLPADYKD
jgi:hypothetical protein